ncbi:fatty acid desaturase [Taibaiella chishuiensis]|uniref:Omega-6 fatty acid desaturase (Delta-12 desaturase) n=1 Tax=Taibaiella chishuiensis TaxID=1434707 RepID=A0A2P8CXE9_9BACT|nr:fatty acid desaturase [Taibaiella chishuiensis]PSK89597.1 omega-6 fatty acid desaturase (delta-12 desaturase) [Taibaiella chishuiensis]
MRKGKELILATKAFAVEDRKKSWWHLLSTLFLFLALIAVALLSPWFPVKIIAGVLQALVIVRLFVIYHDYQHHTILQKSKLANAIMTAFGIYILAPQSIWKRSHDYHHSHNSKLFSASIGSYPIATRSKFNSMSAGERREYLAIRHPLTILLGYFSMFMIGMCVSSLRSSPRRHLDSLLALVLHAVQITLAFIFLGWQNTVAIVFIPFFISTAIGAYLFYAQHNFPGVIFKSNADWAYETAALQSSSYMKMNPFWQWVTANIGYHHIHHLNSRIPFYRLPEVMAHFPELQQPKVTSLSPKDIRDCLRLKIWDPELGQMTGTR